MNCRSVQKYIERFGAPRPGDRDYDQLAAHINSCRACAQAVSQSSAFDGVIAEAIAAPVADADLESFQSRVSATLDRATGPDVIRLRPWYQRPVWRLAPIGLAAALILAFGITLMVGDSQSPDRAEQVESQPDVTVEEPAIEDQTAGLVQTQPKTDQPAETSKRSTVVQGTDAIRSAQTAREATRAQTQPDEEKSPNPKDDDVQLSPELAVSAPAMQKPVAESAGEKLDTSNDRRVAIVGEVNGTSKDKTEDLSLKQLVKQDQVVQGYERPVVTSNKTVAPPSGGLASPPTERYGGTAAEFTNLPDEELANFDEIVALRLHIGALSRALQAEEQPTVGHEHGQRVEELLSAWHRLALISDDATTLDSALSAYKVLGDEVPWSSRAMIRARGAELQRLKVERTE